MKMAEDRNRETPGLCALRREDDDKETARSSVQRIERDLAQRLVDSAVERLNEEEDVRVRSQCLQTLGVLLISNPLLLQHVDERIRRLKEERPRREYIEYGEWKKRDRECPVNAELHHDIVFLIRAPLKMDDDVDRDDDDKKERADGVADGDRMPAFWPRLQSDSYRSVSMHRAQSLSLNSSLIDDDGLGKMVRFEALDEEQPSNGTVIRNEWTSMRSERDEVDPDDVELVGSGPRPMEYERTRYDEDKDFLEDLPTVAMLRSNVPLGSVPVDPDADGKYDEGLSGDESASNSGSGAVEEMEALRPMEPLMETGSATNDRPQSALQPISTAMSMSMDRMESALSMSSESAMKRMASQLEGDEEAEAEVLRTTNLDITSTPGHEAVMAFSVPIPPRRPVVGGPAVIEEEVERSPLTAMRTTASTEQLQFEDFAMRDIDRFGHKIKDRMSAVHSSDALSERKETESDDEEESESDDEEEEQQLMLSIIGMTGDHEEVHFDIPRIGPPDQGTELVFGDEDHDDDDHQSDDDVIAGHMTAGGVDEEDYAD